jgi:hypothetical protein
MIVVWKRGGPRTALFFVKMDCMYTGVRMAFGVDTTFWLCAL